MTYVKKNTASVVITVVFVLVQCYLELMTNNASDNHKSLLRNVTNSLDTK